MGKARSIKDDGDLVVTRRQLNAAFRAHGQKIEAALTESFTAIQQHQAEFEEKVQLALLAIEDDTAKRVADALAATRFVDWPAWLKGLRTR